MVDRELPADLLLEDLDADRVERVVLALGFLLLGADADKSDERPCPLRSSNLFNCYFRDYRLLNGFVNIHEVRILLRRRIVPTFGNLPFIERNAFDRRSRSRGPR